MSYFCRKLSCMHEKDEACSWSRGSYWCCKCDTQMYKSTVHTPASGCSAGTGVSGGPARSVLDQMDDFDVQLKAKLEASMEVTGIEDVAESTAEKVSEWRQNMDALLDDFEGGLEDEDDYVSGSGNSDEVDNEIRLKHDIEIDPDPEFPARKRLRRQQDELVQKVDAESFDEEEKLNQEQET